MPVRLLYTPPTPGVAVQLHGLSRADLNGVVGTMGGVVMDAKGDTRWTVILPSGSQMNIKPANLRLQHDASHAGVTATPAPAAMVSAPAPAKTAEPPKEDRAGRTVPSDAMLHAEAAATAEAVAIVEATATSEAPSAHTAATGPPATVRLEEVPVNNATSGGIPSLFPGVNRDQLAARLAAALEARDAAMSEVRACGRTQMIIEVESIFCASLPRRPSAQLLLPRGLRRNRLRSRCRHGDP